MFNLFWTPIVPLQVSYAAAPFKLPEGLIQPSSSTLPVILRGVKVHPENPLMFDFYVDVGDAQHQGEELKQESEKLIRYFMAALTVPEENLWVNLSPYEKERIVPEKLGMTDLGKDMLAQDYLLKQLTASLMYPENEWGKKFWAKIYQEAQEKYKTTQVPVNTFNKVWIVPEEAVIHEESDAAYMVGGRLKVMLEEDYLAREKGTKKSIKNFKTDKLSSEIIKEIVIPELEREVNEGEMFASLRQMYHSIILAVWYKRNLKKSFLGETYVGKDKVEGIDLEDKTIKQQIYDQYVKAFKKGVYNYIKEEYDPTTQQMIPRKYFSGGLGFERAGYRNDPRDAAVVKAQGGREGVQVTAGLQTTPPKPEFGFGGNAVDGEIVLAQRAAEAGNFDEVQRHIEQAIRLMRDVDFEAMEGGYPVADMINPSQYEIAKDVIRRLIADREPTPEIEEFYLALQEDKNGEELKAALKQDYLRRLSERFGFDLTAEEYSYDTGHLAQLLESRPQVTAEGLQIIGRLEKLAEKEGLDYGLVSATLSKQAQPFSEELMKIFAGQEDQERIVATLVRMKEAGLRVLGITGVLTAAEVEILIRKNEVDLLRLSGMSTEDLIRRVIAVVKGYEDLSRTDQQPLMRRLIPFEIVDLIGDYFGVIGNKTRLIIGVQRNYWNWMKQASNKVKKIENRVGGRANAWFIVIGQGIEKTDDWVARAEKKVGEIQDRVGGNANAWLIVRAQGLTQVDQWLIEAETKVDEIEGRVGGRSNAWTIVRGQGVKKVDAWLEKAEGSVRAIENRVGGRGNAWKIIMGKGLERAQAWVESAAGKVAEIADRVGGENNAWHIAIAQGIERLDDWVVRAERKVEEIENRVGGRTNAWKIVGGQGIEKTDAWVAQAQKKVDMIADRVNPTYAWLIVIGHGIEEADDWVARAEEKVGEIENRVGGRRNAWYIVIRQGIEKVDAWVSRAEEKVDDIEARVGGRANAWTIVNGQGIERTDDWVSRAEKKVEVIKTRVGGAGNAWDIVMSHGFERLDVWISSAEKKVDEIEGRVGGKANAWRIVRGQGVDKVDFWITQAEKKVNEIESRVRNRTNAWVIVISQGLESIDDWINLAERKVSAIKDSVGGEANAWALLIAWGIERVSDEISTRRQRIDEMMRDRGLSLNQAWRSILRETLEGDTDTILSAESADDTPPKPEFGFGGNAVDGEIVLAQRAAEAGDFDAVQ
ncbi:MAG: hypothetical protein NUV91_08445, partial [Candidatus Omnitrophica bacterium]|nr:hypothetical protein [Candidatus Omnitrophota bacterium]